MPEQSLPRKSAIDPGQTISGRQWRVEQLRTLDDGEQWLAVLVTPSEDDARAHYDYLRSLGKPARLWFRDWPTPPAWERVDDA